MTTHVIRAQVAPDFMLWVTSPVVSHFPPLALTTSTLSQLRANTAVRDPGYLVVPSISGQIAHRSLKI